ncbi:unnamed protein product [Bursaphelenchus okinawaensis]|uniref:Uncharacterized protein n=1 Tax=Bursaphelenchus okinawaensis TaxID=465554 RepID=A0A811L0W1_9BILA|nr:unnamed protein product [Bursaphelenchus okinawaensis]CAG9114730.1 unnamed protein product [Bursaphelenchus okinawaensis]
MTWTETREASEKKLKAGLAQRLKEDLADPVEVYMTEKLEIMEAVTLVTLEAALKEMMMEDSADAVEVSVVTPEAKKDSADAVIKETGSSRHYGAFE